MPDVDSIPFRQADPNGHYRSKQLPNDSSDFRLLLGLPAVAGDVNGPGGSVVGQVAIFDDTTGKRLNTTSYSGLAKLASGVLSSVAAPTGAVVGTTDVQTLTNKTLVSPIITGAGGIEMQTNKGVANGYASLDASTKVPLAQIPDSVVGASQYQGTWNAATNTPAIPAAAIGNKGWYYSVSVAGSTSINGINSWAVGDQIISNGTVWQKIPNTQAVNSVNGQTGTVVLTKTDVGLSNVDNTSDATKNAASVTLTNKTLTSPVITSPTGLVKADVGLGNVDNVSNATQATAIETLTNKTINGANNTLTVRLASDVTGNLPVTNLNAGTGANSGSFWRGDGQWAPPAGGGDVVGPAGGVVDGELVSYSGTTGKIIKASGGKLTTNLVAGPASSVATNLATYTDTTGKLIGQLSKSGLTTDFLNGTNAYADLAAAVKPTIWSARQRSFNAVGNPNFEVDQRFVGAVVPTTSGMCVDRWNLGYAGTLRVSTQQVAANVAVPGSNFYATNKIERITLTTAQASLGATDYLLLQQTVEGPSLRELLGDVHSVSLLVRSSVANLKFALLLRDGAVTPTRSLLKLCSMGAANTWTLITLPNLPGWAAGGVWDTTPGAAGYLLGICLASGTTYTAPATDVWQTGNYLGAPGMSNFANNAVNSTFDIAFVQHEPGSECGGLMDVSWRDNYRDCLRYFTKSCDYGAATYTASANGSVNATAAVAASYILTPIVWGERMAKLPTVYGFSNFNGQANTVYNNSTTSNIAISGTGVGPGQVGFSGFSTTAALGLGHFISFHWIADTGW